MNKNRQSKVILIILFMVIGILSFILFFVVYKNNYIKNQGVVNVIMNENVLGIEKYGYSDILDTLRKNSDLNVISINMRSNEICNIEVEYSGDIKLLYDSLYSLNESKNLLIINSVNINSASKITTISLDFKKNK